MQPSYVTIHGLIYVSGHHLPDSTNSRTFPVVSKSNRGKLFTKQMSPETTVSRLKECHLNNHLIHAPLVKPMPFFETLPDSHQIHYFPRTYLIILQAF